MTVQALVNPTEATGRVGMAWETGMILGLMTPTLDPDETEYQAVVAARPSTRAALLRAADRLFGEHGYDAVTMTDVAAAAGVSRPTAFRYFASKADLVFAPQESWYAAFRALADSHDDVPPFDRVELLALGVTDVIIGDREAVLRSYAIEMSTGALRDVSAGRQQRWASLVTEILAPVLPRTVARIAGTTVTALLYACFGEWAADPERTDLRRLVAEALPIVMTGLRDLDGRDLDGRHGRAPRDDTVIQ